PPSLPRVPYTTLFRSDLIKAGVMLLDLVPDTLQQGELDLEDEGGRDRTRLMSAMDCLNDRFGKGTVHVASTGLDDHRREWGMRQDRKSTRLNSSHVKI